MSIGSLASLLLRAERLCFDEERIPRVALVSALIGISQMGDLSVRLAMAWDDQARSSQQIGDPKPVLQGWKEIAVALERGLRTIQRWEQIEELASWLV